MKVQFKEDEYWWGGAAHHGSFMPIGAEDTYGIDLSSVSASNQSVPFFLSTAGRYIWNEEPFSVKFEKGFIVLDDGIEVSQSYGNTLKSAYEEAMSKHFPFNGKTVAVFVNNEFVLLKETNETAGGFISCNNNFTGTANAYLSDILITEYYDGAIPANAVVKSPPPRVNKDKTSEHKVDLSTNSNNETDIKNDNIEASGLSTLVIVLISLAAVVFVAAVVLAVVFIVIKRRKKTN